MNRTDLINALLAEIQAPTYLEIGVKDGKNFEAIRAARKIGIDPSLGLTLSTIQKLRRYLCMSFNVPVYLRDRNKVLFSMTSDEYFLSKYTQCVDIVFIDGLHHFDQVLKDYFNSLKWLNESGAIVFHDSLPPDEDSAGRERKTKSWNGDVWKAIYWLSKKSVDITVFDFDEGCAVAKKNGSEFDFPSDAEISALSALTYNDFRNFRDSLTLISEDRARSLHERSVILNAC